MLSVTNLRCEYQNRPLGLDVLTPRLSWEILSERRGAKQQSFRVFVRDSRDKDIWDSGIVTSEDVWYHLPEGAALKSRGIYTWTVIVTDDNKETAKGTSDFEMGLLNIADWHARWIEPEQKPVYREPEIAMDKMFEILKRDGKIPFNYDNIFPCRYLRRSFSLEAKPLKARVYITAHGLYRLEVNGLRATQDEFTPGYTSYDKYLSYQTYDLTSLLRQGENVIGAILADGWYAGRIGGTGENCQYGDRLGLLMQLEITTETGPVVITSDKDFVGGEGPLRYSDIFLGEKYDARKEIPGWSTPGFYCEGWPKANFTDYPLDNLRAEYGEPVRAVETIPVSKIIITPKGETVVDFGQVLAGRVEMKVSGPAGTEVILEHSEVLDEQGNFINNIFGRYKDQMDIYVLNGMGVETYEPFFTFHGFRFVKLTGYLGEVKPENFCAHVITSAMESAGSFQCSSTDLNQLQHNILWSLIGNTLSVPTDCPQRERAGWTGDAQIIAETVCANLGAIPFFEKWMRNLALEQKSDGQVPIVIPFISSYQKAPQMPLAKDILSDNCTSAGWGDVVTILPWSLYQATGDISVLERYYGNMCRWVYYIKNIAENYNPSDLGPVSPERAKHLKYLWNTNFHFGDWLTPSVSLDPVTGTVDMERSARLTNHYVPTCFYAASTEIAAKTAEVLGYSEDAKKFRALLDNIEAAFAYEYIGEDGSLKFGMQGFHVLALHFGLVPEKYRQKVFERLISLIEENGDRLDTGFLSVPYLLDVLTENDRPDKAITLLYQDKCPSWLYEIRNAATTIWESWQGILPDGRVGKDSYNHYAFGCVGAWMYRELGGLKATAPGYKTFDIDPLDNAGLNWAETVRHTVYGEICVRWEKTGGGGANVHINVPVGCLARIKFHTGLLKITEGGKPVAAGNGIIAVSAGAMQTIVEVGNGKYMFTMEGDNK